MSFSDPQKQISIVSPVFNEAESIPLFVSELKKIELNEIAEIAEIILIDDGSTDATWLRILEQVAEHSGIKGIRFSRNFGKEAAISAGLQEAEGDAVVVMDCDLQHPPQSISLMVEEWSKGARIVNGRKSLRQKESFSDRVFAGMYYRLLRIATGMNLANASDFKLLDRSVVLVLNNIPERETFFRALNEWIGFPASEIQFIPEERSHGKSKWSRLKKLRLAIMSITSFSSAPIKLVGLTGVLMALFSMYVVLSVAMSIVTGTAVEGFATVILVQLIATTLLMISQGVLALYIYRIFIEVKNRPRFIIQDLQTRESLMRREVHEN